MSAASSREDRLTQALAKAEDRYEKALTKYESAPENPVFEKILGYADKQLLSAQETLRAFLKTLPQGSVGQHALSPGAFLGALLTPISLWLMPPYPCVCFFFI
jgi:hypothetical protein